MLPDRVSNPGPLTYKSGALLIALRGPATTRYKINSFHLPGSALSSFQYKYRWKTFRIFETIISILYSDISKKN